MSKLIPLVPLVLTVGLLLQNTSSDCGAARDHTHNRLQDVEVAVASWEGCVITGSIEGVSTRLFMDVSNCPLRAQVPGRFRIRYDQSCGAVLEITDGPAIPTPMPPSCPSPSPTTAPTPTPTPPLQPSPDGTKATTIVDEQGVVWTLGRELQTLRDNVHVGRGAGVVYKWSGGLVYVMGTDNLTWYRWEASVWVEIGRQEPGGSSTAPTPSPTPAPSPCVFSAPSSVIIPKNGTAMVVVSLTNPPGSSVISAESSSPGQVSVSPASRTVAGGTNVTSSFDLRAKKQGAQITFTSVCGDRVVAVQVR